MSDNHPVNSPLVLIVDDHPPATEMLKRLFENNDFRTECAFDGYEALRLARLLQPDLIILDVMMPGLNGFEVLKELRAHQFTSDIPTILATAKDTQADIEQGLKLGADDYVIKPIKPRELLARAQSKLESRRLREALRQRTKDLEALLRVTEELNAQLHVEDLLRLVVLLVHDLLPVIYAEIVEIDDEKATQRGFAASNSRQESSPQINARPIVEDLLNISHTMYTWNEQARSPLSDYSCGALMMLQQNDLVYGVLTVASERPFDINEQRLFQGIARQTTLALRHAELYESEVRNALYLEDMVNERTAELRQAQQLLIQSEKLASVGRLAAGIAHEINNPLLPILINLEHMLEDLENGDRVHTSDVEETLHSAQRISRIVERLLQFTRSRSNNAMTTVEMSINHVVENVAALSRKLLQKQGVTLEVNLESQQSVYGNPDQLEQVFLNMILNAQDAMTQAGVIRVRTYDTYDMVIVEIQDNGIGIAEDVLKTLFEPFTSTKEDGNGLGLFISHEIIRSHNGNIRVETQVGKGTQFVIELPTVSSGFNT